MKERSYPKYYRIQQQIIEDIKTGRFSNGSKLPSEYEYAATLGVNRLTVRKAYQELIEQGILYAVQGRGTFVSDSDNVKALEAAGTKRRRIIGIIFPETTSFFSVILNTIEKRASDTGYMLNVMFNDTPEREKAAIDSMIQNHVDGVIITPVRMDDSLRRDNYQRLMNSGIPAIMYGRPPFGILYDAVYADDVHASYEATKYLISRGHSHITHICNHFGDSVAYDERMAGYKKAMLEYLGLNYVSIIDINDSDVLENTIASIQNGTLSAIYTDIEDFVLALYSQLSARGIAVPEGFECICYVATDLIARFQLPVIAQEVPKVEMATRAFEMIFEKMGNTGQKDYTASSVFYPALSLPKSAL